MKQKPIHPVRKEAPPVRAERKKTKLSNGVHLAKITRPTLSGVLPRKRLFHLLDSGRRQPIIWIHGHPGSGKTTLVTSYLDARKLPYLWYQLDERDGDVASFFYYLRMAVSQTIKKQKPLPVLGPEYLPGLSTFAKRFFEALYNKMPSPFIFVFDNYQDVPPSSNFHEVLHYGLSLIPEGINAIVMSRTTPPPAMARLRASNKIEFIGWNELRLTLNESGKIVKLQKQKAKPNKAIRQLYAKTDGWAAGLTLMLESGKIEEIKPKSLDKFTPNAIFDYFSNEIIENIDRETYDFLLQSSFLPSMTVHMAERLTGIKRANQILSSLNQYNYFTTKHPNPEPVYQYHPLFREFLLSKARSSFSVTKLLRVQNSAAMLLDESGQYEDAVYLLRNISDWNGLTRLIISHAPVLMSHGRVKTLIEWLESLPKEIIENTSWLLYWLGICRLPFNLDESLVYFEKAFHLFKKQKDSRGAFLSWAEAVNSIFYKFGDFSLADRWMELLKDFMIDNPTFPSIEVEAKVTSSFCISLTLRQPDHPEFDKWFERIISLSKRDMELDLKVPVINHLALHYIFIGDFAKAWENVKLIQEFIKRKECNHLCIIASRLREAIYYVFMAQSEQCLKVVSEILKIAQSSGIHILDSRFLGFAAAASLTSGDISEAKIFLQKMSLELKSDSYFDTSFYYFLSSWNAILQGDIPLALTNQERALADSVRCGSPLPDANYHLGMAQILHERREYKKSVFHLTLARHIGSQMKSLIVEYMCLLSEAQFALDRGSEKSCLKPLRKAMALGREMGYVNFFYWRPSVMARLCLKALESGIEIEYVQDLIRRRNLTPDTLPINIENWAYALKIWTLGKFELEKDGRTVQFKRKVQKMPLSMLKAIIAHGGKDVTEEQLTDDLWPEADGDMAHQSFKVTLHRLRQLIGNEKVIHFSEGRVTLDPRYCWVDTWVFENLSEEIDTLIKKANENSNKAFNINKLTCLIEKILTIYRGYFLGKDTGESSWANPLREKLHNKFIKSIISINNYYEQNRQYNKAIEYYQKGLEVAEITEEFYQGIMYCYQKLNRRSEAISVYNRCKSLLSTVLSINPSPKTEALYQELIRK